MGGFICLLTDWKQHYLHLMHSRACCWNNEREILRTLMYPH